jgi:hypothetical protein
LNFEEILDMQNNKPKIKKSDQKKSTLSNSIGKILSNLAILNRHGNPKKKTIVLEGWRGRGWGILWTGWKKGV